VRASTIRREVDERVLVNMQPIVSCGPGVAPTDSD